MRRIAALVALNLVLAAGRRSSGSWIANPAEQGRPWLTAYSPWPTSV